MMFGISRIQAFIGGGTLIALAAALAWGAIERGLHQHWRGIALAITSQIAYSTHQDRISTKDAVAAVRRLGIERDQERELRRMQTAQINAMAIEAERLRKLSADAKAQAQVAIVKRDAAIKRLGQAALSPGDRANCVEQLNEARATLAYVFDQGA